MVCLEDGGIVANLMFQVGGCVVGGRDEDTCCPSTNCACPRDMVGHSRGTPHNLSSHSVTRT